MTRGLAEGGDNFFGKIIYIGALSAALLGISYFVGQKNGYNSGRVNQRESIIQYLKNEAYDLRRDAIYTPGTAANQERIVQEAYSLETAVKYIEAQK